MPDLSIPASFFSPTFLQNVMFVFQPSLGQMLSRNIVSQNIGMVLSHFTPLKIHCVRSMGLLLMSLSILLKVGIHTDIHIDLLEFCCVVNVRIKSEKRIGSDFFKSHIFVIKYNSFLCSLFSFQTFHFTYKGQRKCTLRIQMDCEFQAR